MAQPEDSCVAYWKLEDVTAEIGQNLVEGGTINWNAGKFNNGARAISSGNNLSVAVENFFTPNKYIVDMWFKSEGWNCVNGVSSDAATHTFFWQYYDANNFHGVVSFASGLLFFEAIGGTNYMAFFTTGANWTAGNLHHIAFLKERNGTADEERLIYLDGVKLTPTSWAGAHNPANQANTGGKFTLLTDQTGGSPFEGLEDNVKIYNDAEAIIASVISNKDTEEWPVTIGVPTNVLASDGVYQDKVTVDWGSATIGDTYEIQRASSLAGVYATVGAWQSATSFNDSTGALESEYWYKVRGMDVSSNTGDFSVPDVGSRGYTYPQIIRLESKNKMHVFRRLYMKRRISGEYESDWQRIPQKYIMKFGKISFSVDDIKVNFLKYSGLTFKAHNDAGYFSDVDENKSFFYGADSRYKSLVKVEAGYLDTSGAEWPSSTILYVGVLGEDITTSERNEMTFKTKQLSSIFSEVPASDIPGLGTSLTASEIMTQIKGYTDGSNNLIFQKYISSGGWNITATTNYYNLETNSALQGLNCWKLMVKLAEAENKVVYVDKSGDFFFRDKTPLTDTAVYHFHGLGDTEREYGHNVKSRIAINKGLRKVYNRVRVKFQDSDTLASYYIKKESWAWGDSSSSFLHGVRTYDYVNTWVDDSATAQSIGDEIYGEYKDPKSEIKISSKFIPQLELNDRVGLRYRTRVVEDADRLWGYAVWDNFVWGERSGYNVDINGDFRLINISHDIDTFESRETLREI